MASTTIATTTTCLYEQWLALHEGQLKGSNIPEHVWYVLYEKVREEIFDAGNYFEIVSDEHEQVHIMMKQDLDEVILYHDGFDTESEGAVFLVDHAWTFTADKAREQLNTIDGLVDRLKVMLQLCHFDKQNALNDIDFVMENIWKLVSTYRISHLEPQESRAIFYVNDEFGSLLSHSETPNMAMAPFFNCETQCAYSVIWPIDVIEPGDFITRDVIVGTRQSDTRIAKLYGLFPEQYETELQQVVSSRKDKKIVEPIDETRDNEKIDGLEHCLPMSIVPEKRFKVYSDLTSFVLTHDRFEKVDNPEEADILWPSDPIKDFSRYAKDESIVIINQFPNEKVLSSKELLYEVCKRSNHHTCPEWMMLSFNMETELPELMEEFRQGKTDYWICKPWNMARGLEMTITSNTGQLARMVDTGPKLACKYIEHPVLFHGKKFDLRYIVMVKSVDPLEIYVSKVFYPRFANKEFNMTDFEDIEKHLTVMNYADGKKVIEMESDDFISEFEAQYPQTEWIQIEREIYHIMKEIFVLVHANGAGLKPFSKSRAVYGIDMMLQWNEEKQMQPKLLEVNFQPDLRRPYKYNPDIYNDLLVTLVLNEPQNTVHGVVKL